MTYFKYINIFLFFFLVCIATTLQADVKPISVSKTKTIFILPSSEIFVSPEKMLLQQVISENKFKPFHSEHLNLGVSKDYIYIHFMLKNPTANRINKVIVASSPLLENLKLCKKKDAHVLCRNAGIVHLDESHNTIPFSFPLKISSNAISNYYLMVHSDYNAIDFTLTLENMDKFAENDRTRQVIDLILVGIIIALMFYSIFLSLYIRDRSYFFYGLYLFALLYQQLTYLGLTQIYLPTWFALFDLRIAIVKISMLLLTAALFAIFFLETKQYKYIHRVYQLIIVITFFQVLLLPPKETYSMIVVIATGTFFIFFNLFSGIYIYNKGLKQARLFIVGFSIVSLFYIAMILDTLGITSLMYYFNNALMWGSAVEAFVLSLAFADRYLILQKEKRETEQKMLFEAQQRTDIIEKEVIKKTEELNQALETKDLLIQEIHHRVKNNLQIILSIIHLQNAELKNKKIKEKLTDLEYRINAIAKTYMLLLDNTNLEEINMQTYIETLLSDISESYNHYEDAIELVTDVHATMPIKESIYVGLLINELVTNSYKHAFKGHKGIITIKLKENEKHYTLIVKDNGSGFNFDKKHQNLGLKLIQTLIQNQLEGTWEVFTEHQTKYIIRFTL